MRPEPAGAATAAAEAGGALCVISEKKPAVAAAADAAMTQPLPQLRIFEKPPFSKHEQYLRIHRHRADVNLKGAPAVLPPVPLANRRRKLLPEVGSGSI